jgi:hypothetical protein
MSGDGFRLADRTGEDPVRVLRRAFVALVVLVFLLGLPLGTAATVIGTILVLLALAVELLLPRDRLLARWSGLAADRAGSADSAYAAAYQALRAREVPAEVRPHRVRTPAGVRNGLTARAGADRVEIAVFPAGRDLALGWSMWHREIPARTVLSWLQATMAGGPADDGPARAALAAAVHAAVAEGVTAAESGQEIPLAEAFGQDVPVEDRSVPSAAPAAAGPPGPDGRSAPQPAGSVHGSMLARLRGARGTPPQPGGRSGGRHTGERPAARAGRPAEPPIGAPVPPMGPPMSPMSPMGPPADATMRVGPVGGGRGWSGQQGEPGGRPPLVPGLGDVDERTAVISPVQFNPYEFTVAVPVEVFTPDGAVVGRLEPGTRYWAVDEHPAGLVVQIAAGAALLRNRAAVRPE